MIKMPSSSMFFRRIAPIFLVISLFVIYLFSMAPDFTWAHDGADGGDLITAAATGGVAHPSGYPTFLLLARLFQFLPLGTIAYRTNLMSAVFTALTALLLYDILVGSPNSPAKDKPIAGLIAGYAYGLSPLAWSQAVITEVYALHLFFVALIIWLLLGRFAYSPQKWLLDAGIGLSVGLGMGNHLTTVFLVPLALLVGIVAIPSPEPKGKKKSRGAALSIDWASLGRRLGGIFVGLLIYTSVLWRASSNAPVNWGDAANLNNLWWLVSGAFYQHYAFALPMDEVALRVKSIVELLFTQFGIFGLLVGLYHLFGNSSLSRLSLITGWVAATNAIFSLGYASTDSYIYLMPAFLVFAIWIGAGVGNVTTLLAQQKNWISLGVNAIVLISFLVMAVMNYPKIDLSADHHAEKFGKTVFATLPPQAIVLAKGDLALFSLWYYHFVLKERPDISVLGDGLLSQPWYIDILHNTYSTLNISLDVVESQTIAQVNPNRPTCVVLIVDPQVSINCYLPASQNAATQSISIMQPIDK